MQIDAHHIFVKDWDTKCIEMLHSCDAGEYSVLTAYAGGYNSVDLSNYFSYTVHTNYSEALYGLIILHNFVERGWFGS